MNQPFPTHEFQAEGEDDYDRLPEAIKFSLPREGYMWLSDAEKARLIQDECEPEW